MSDLLRAARHFPAFYKAIQLHMVEQSAEMIKKQQYALDCVYRLFECSIQSNRYPSGAKPNPNSKDKKTHMRINGPTSIDVYLLFPSTFLRCFGIVVSMRLLKLILLY